MANVLPHNEHMLERILRIVLGLFLLSLYFTGPHSAWGLIGFIPLATGFIGSCPLYTVLGINTCGVKKA
jgi:hypothetical protein